MDNSPQYKLNMVGLKAPRPVLRLKVAMDRLADNEVLHLTYDDELTTIDIQAYIKHSGHRLLSLQDQDSPKSALIQKSALTTPGAHHATPTGHYY